MIEVLLFILAALVTTGVALAIPVIDSLWQHHLFNKTTCRAVDELRDKLLKQGRHLYKKLPDHVTMYQLHTEGKMINGVHVVFPLDVRYYEGFTQEDCEEVERILQSEEKTIWS